jgi:hypothetical protein
MREICSYGSVGVPVREYRHYPATRKLSRVSAFAFFLPGQDLSALRTTFVLP